MKKKILLFLLIICIFLSFNNNLENFVSTGTTTDKQTSNDIRDTLANEHLELMEQQGKDLDACQKKTEELEKEIQDMKEAEEAEKAKAEEEENNKK